MPSLLVYSFVPSVFIMHDVSVHKCVPDMMVYWQVCERRAQHRIPSLCWLAFSFLFFSPPSPQLFWKCGGGFVIGPSFCFGSSGWTDIIHSFWRLFQSSLGEGGELGGSGVSAPRPAEGLAGVAFSKARVRQRPLLHCRCRRQRRMATLSI